MLKAVAAFVLLAGTSVAVAGETMVVEQQYVPGRTLINTVGSVLSNLHLQAADKCPNGFDVLHEWSRKRTDGDYQYFMEIRCRNDAPVAIEEKRSSWEAAGKRSAWEQ